MSRTLLLLEVDGARRQRRIACRPARSAMLPRSTRPASPACDAGRATRDLAPETELDDIAVEVDGRTSSREKGPVLMIESDFRPLRARYDVHNPTVAYVPNVHGGKYAGYLYLLASAGGPVLSVPGIVGGLDDSEPDSASAKAFDRPTDRTVGAPTDGWYVEIQCFSTHLEMVEGPSAR